MKQLDYTHNYHIQYNPINYDLYDKLNSIIFPSKSKWNNYKCTTKRK